MGIEVADRTVHFGQQRHLRHARYRGFQADQHIGHFFADCGRAGGLAVGAAEHGIVGVAVRHLAQFVCHLVQTGQQHLRTRCLELQRMAGVVDVFAGAGEMYELQRCGEFGFQCIRQTGLLALRLEPILHRLHIMVGGFFNLFDGQCISR